jgi:hypothetical protein
MQTLDLLIIITIIILIYKYYNSYYLQKDENKEDFAVDFEGAFGSKKEIKENVYDTSMKYIDLILKSKKKQVTNPYVIDSHFHNDYRDTLNAFQMLVPNQRQLFNRGDLPIINVSTPSNSEIKPLLKNFIKEANKVLDNNVADELHVRDWKNNYGEKEHDRGWDKQQEKLGLPGSIYTDPAKKAHIKLVKVNHSERRETEDEIQYIIFAVVQKVNVKDQMVVKVSFHIDKQDHNIERDFFAKGKNSYETLVKIEEVFVDGFLTKTSFGKHSIKAKYYDYGGITDGRMFSQEDIMREINKKRKQYELECVA